MLQADADAAHVLGVERVEFCRLCIRADDRDAADALRADAAHPSSVALLSVP